MKESLEELYYRFWRSQTNLYYFIKHLFFPANKELRNVIPRYWTDKDFLVVEFIFKTIELFVEEEKAYEHIDLIEDAHHFSDRQMEAYKGIYEVYEYIKQRPKDYYSQNYDLDTEMATKAVEYRYVLFT